MLEIKFFQIKDNYYAKSRHNGVVVDTTAFYNIDMQIGDFIKGVMQMGYTRDEITFIIHPNCAEYETAAINNAIEIYA